MNGEEILRGLSDIDSALVADAALPCPCKKRIVLRWTTLAACLCLAAGGGLLYSAIGRDGSPAGTPDASSGSAEGTEVVVQQDGPYYDSLAKLAAAADWIVRGTLQGETTGEEAGRSYTVQAIDVTEVKKGDLKAGTQISLWQSGVSPQQTGKDTASSFVALEEGQEYVFFLQRGDQYCYFISPFQGCYRYEAGAAATDMMESQACPPGMKERFLTYAAYDALS